MTNAGIIVGLSVLIFIQWLWIGYLQSRLKNSRAMEDHWFGLAERRLYALGELSNEIRELKDRFSKNQLEKTR